MVATASPKIIAERIALAIREKVIAPGAPLVQEDLARRFEVSRSPIREALRILATEGVIELAPGGGASVRRLDRAELEELYDLRLMLEPTIAPLVVEHATTAVLTGLDALATEMETFDDVGRWMRSNFEFHSRLYEAADRPRTQDILRGLLSAVQPYSQENIDQLGGRGQADGEHREMIEAIREGDGERLAELFRVHLLSAKTRVAHALVEQEADIDPLAPLRG
jgi:DNA-binding GntR family transcriptional regulator